MFKYINPEASKDVIHRAVTMAGGPVNSMQMVIPDRGGLFPWDDGFDRAFANIQPLLYDEAFLSNAKMNNSVSLLDGIGRRNRMKMY